MKYIRESQCRPGDKVGFLIGHSGIYAVGAVIAHAKNDQASLQSNLKQFQDIFPLALQGRLVIQ